MLDLLLHAIGAFLLFVVGFPLAGMILGFLIRVCLPYAIGPVAISLAVQAFGVAWGWWALFLLSAVWMLSIVHVRQRLSRIYGKLHWSEGHYNGAVNIVTFAHPLRKGKLLGQQPAQSGV